MQLQVSHGIVLHTQFPHQKCALFDKQIGHVHAYMHNNRKLKNIFPGAYISYALEPWRSNYKITDIELIGLPAQWAQQDLLFLHHILELSYYFLPLHCNAHELFELLRLLYKQHKLSYKKFMCRFFQRLGIYPEQPTNYDQLFLEYMF